MKKSELKEMISEIVEEKLEDFFINDLNEIVTKIVSTKMSKMLKEANKGTLKDRIMNKIDQKEMSDYDQMNEIAFGERGARVGINGSGGGAHNFTNEAVDLNDRSAQLRSTGKSYKEVHKQDIDNLAQCEWSDEILGIDS